MSEAAPYRVALPEFEGPLDLLLHLCKTHEIEVVNLPIAFITSKYLEYLEIMQTMSVDVAADYLVMAATLAYLKSRELVPQPEPLEAAADGEEEEPLDPREELIRRLLEYQKYKDAAEQLGGRPIEGRNVFGRGAPIESIDIGPGPVADESVWKLIGAFGRILEKASKTAGSTHNVIVDRMSIGARINQLVDRLQQGGGSFLFESCFDLTLSEPELRNQIVVTLLSILELARLKVVRVLQAEDQETLFVTHIAGTDLEAARRVHVTSADEDEESDEESDAAEGAEGVEGAEVADATLAASEDIGEAASEEHDVSVKDETNAEGFDEGDLTDAGGGFDEEAEGDATLVEPAPAGASEVELKDPGESEE
jgi:segregation and condensation protein A